MEFGKNWLAPIQERLSKKVPNLSEQDLDRYNSLCKTIIDDGIDILVKMIENIDSQKPMGRKVLSIDFEKVILSKYEWMNKKNLKHLYSQAMYYARKDGISIGKVK
jgi:hypothetical protein